MSAGDRGREIGPEMARKADDVAHSDMQEGAAN
jgi:hypothetical protein